MHDWSELLFPKFLSTNGLKNKIQSVFFKTDKTFQLTGLVNNRMDGGELFQVPDRTKGYKESNLLQFSLKIIYC